VKRNGEQISGVAVVAERGTVEIGDGGAIGARGRERNEGHAARVGSGSRFAQRIEVVELVNGGGFVSHFFGPAH